MRFIFDFEYISILILFCISIPWCSNPLKSETIEFSIIVFALFFLCLTLFYSFSLSLTLITFMQGPVSFSGADRIGISVFSQVQDGRLQSVALFHPSKLHLDFDCLKCVPIKWKNGQVPIAKRVFKLRVATISPYAFFIVSTLALIGIILSISFLAFNLHFRKLKWVNVRV